MNTFVAIMIQTISGSPLYDPLIIHGKRVDPTLLLKLWRILFGAGVACCYITFGTIGVYSHDNFVVWRRAALFPVGAVSCIVSPVLLYIFGNNVIRVIISAPGGHKSESNPESSTGDGVKLETKTEKKLAVVSGVGPSRDSKPRKSTGKANTQRKVDSLQRAIYGPIAVFIVSGIVFFMAPIINDLFEGNPTAMFYGKVFLDGSTVFPGLFLSWYYAGKLYELIKS